MKLINVYFNGEKWSAMRVTTIGNPSPYGVGTENCCEDGHVTMFYAIRHATILWCPATESKGGKQTIIQFLED